MRLSDNTSDIPDRLISLQERGEVVFLCGAGISQRYNLPSFRKLTEDIYADIGESWVGYPAEEDAMGIGKDGTLKGPAALDRALFALSKRLRGNEAATRIRAERMLTAAIETSLQPPAGPFSAHKDVWTLSRDAEMRQRIVTTNFDTLFERTGPSEAASRACADLPPPLGTDFTGVLHLHGRIADEKLGLSRTSLVLTSAEFGEAYLRSGWAARYIYDLARATNIVILGYGADDPPMRYILEVLTADRERYPDIREIFAFVPSAPDELSREREMAIWEAKGATAITYDSGGPSDHDMLYQTISSWAEFAVDPTGWRRAHASRILGQNPDEVSENDWERLRWLLSNGDAGELLGEINPSPHWVSPLVKADVFRPNTISPYRWILARLNDREMAGEVAESVQLPPETLDAIGRYLGRRNRNSDEFDPVLLQAWRLLIQVATERYPSDYGVGFAWFQAKEAISEGDFSLKTKRDVLLCLRPRINVGRVIRWLGLEEDPAAETLALRHVLRIEWGPGSHDELGVLAEKWPDETRPNLLRALLRELEDALEEAADTDTLYIASSDVSSVSLHSQDVHSDGFYSIVRVVVDLWEAECAVRPVRAKALAVEWLASPYLLLRRMGLHALRQPFFNTSEVADHLMGMTDEDFWLSDARRETMQIFVQRWPTVVDADRARVEERICAGLPRDLLRADGDPDQIAVVRDNAVFIRLARIEGTGFSLSPLAVDALARLRDKHPSWVSSGEQDDFRIWSSGIRTIDRMSDVSLLADTPTEKILDRVEEVVGGNSFAHGDLWRLYCDAEPQSALAALISDDPTGTKRAGAWQSFFWSIAAAERDDIQQLAFDAISRQGFQFEPYTSIADWLLRRRKSLSISTETLLALWDRLFTVIKDHARPVEDQSRRDVVFSMWNSAEGKIGTLLLDEYKKVRGDEGLDNQLAILNRLEKLVSAEGALGFLGTAAAIDGLQVLFSEHEDWATKWLLPLTTWTSPFAPVAWAVLLRRPIPQSNLYAALKAGLLEAGSHSDLDHDNGSVAHWMITPLLWAQASSETAHEITSVEVRRALAKSADGVRRSAAFWFTKAIEQLEGPGGDLWLQRIGPLFKQIWPIDPSCRSSGASVHLLRLALSTENAFSEAVEAIAPALGPLDTWTIESYLGRNEDAKEFYITDPAAVLTLLEAVVAEDGVPNSLLSMLEKLVDGDAALRADPRYKKLLGWARRRAGS